MRPLAAAVAAVAALVAAVPAQAARWAVGLGPGADADAVAARLAERGAVSRDLLPLGALVVETRTGTGLAAIPGVDWVERVDRGRRLAFTPPDPLAAKQWYLGAIRAFDAWPQPPSLAGPLVAVVDSGVDASHPDFAGRIAGGRSFVGSPWNVDTVGHGTIVAGLLAAAHDGKGMAGIAFPSRLLVAKVVGADGFILPEAEARAIRWAVDQGARVVNLSIGGVRDPVDPANDLYSPLEAAAVDYARARGVVVVAAVGNADMAPSEPWPFAGYPAALPHVLGVSALTRSGDVPTFSDRDRIFNDLAAPGEGVYSTIPLALSRAGCASPGYSECGPEDYRSPEGTSFAAPQVAAAAALLLAVRPELTPDQVGYVLTRSAHDVNAATGCRQCPLSRDAFSGWGRLDVAAAVTQATTGKLPRADALETNDDAGARAPRIYGARGGTVKASVDFWDDQTDVYRVYVRPGKRVFAVLSGAPGGTKLFLWKPGTRAVEGLSPAVQRMRLVQSRTRGTTERLAYRVTTGKAGWYYLQVKLAKPGAGAYTLSYTKR